MSVGLRVIYGRVLCISLGLYSLSLVSGFFVEVHNSVTLKWM